MWLECTCVDINKKRWDELMKGARPLNYNWLVKKIKKELPNVYRDLDLDLYNPYSNQCYVTKTHYILVHSAIEYFFNKGEDPNKDDDLDDYYPNDENNIYYENKKNMKKVIRLTESDLHRIVENSVKKMLKEFDMNNDYQQYQLGHAAGWAQKKRNAATSDAEWNKYHNMMRTAEKHSNQTPTNGHTFPQYNVGRYNAMQGQH